MINRWQFKNTNWEEASRKGEYNFFVGTEIPRGGDPG